MSPESGHLTTPLRRRATHRNGARPGSPQRHDGTENGNDQQRGHHDGTTSTTYGNGDPAPAGRRDAEERRDRRRNAPFHSPLSTRHSPLATPHSTLACCPRASAVVSSTCEADASTEEMTR